MPELKPHWLPVDHLREHCPLTPFTAPTSSHASGPLKYPIHNRKIRFKPAEKAAQQPCQVTWRGTDGGLLFHFNSYTMDFKAIAQQLRKPDGELGKGVALKMNEGNACINKLSIEALGLKPGDHVLEIGMGNGAFVKDILTKDAAIKYVGCDISEMMVEEARNLNKDFTATGQAKFVASSEESLPFSTGSFTVVFTVNTIYFWDNPEQELVQIKRVLNTNGKLLIALRPKSVMKALPFVRYGFNLYEKEEVEALLSKNGFVVMQAIQQAEPPQEMNGTTIPMETLLILARPDSSPI